VLQVRNQKSKGLQQVEKTKALKGLDPVMTMRNVSELIPYARNSRTHSPEQIKQIAASIREFGFLNPVILDGSSGVVAGHGRLMAAAVLDLKTVPCVDAAYLTESQKRAYVIADNRLALSAGWDLEMLQVELSELKIEGFGIDVIGFDPSELSDIFGNEDLGHGDENYSRKVIAPIYEVSGPCPNVSDLVNQEKAASLRGAIAAADLPDDIREFLNIAADRHIVFDFGRIANFYAHADLKIQNLMEDSALIIIDFDKAIEGGFVSLTDELGKLYTQDTESGDDDAE
jgi:hypothetical protein